MSEPDQRLCLYGIKAWDAARIRLNTYCRAAFGHFKRSEIRSFAQSPAPIESNTYVCVLGKEFPLSQPVRAILIPLHRVISFLARRPSYSSLVGDSSIELSSLSNPAEHVGSHSGGVFGCLAESGSDGIAGVTTALLSCVEALLQALKSTASALSIATRGSQLFLCICICFLRRGLAPLVFLNDVQRSAAVALADFGAVCGKVGPSLRGVRLRR